MAISAYGKALASMAKESVLGSVQSFASDVKSSAMSEMPALSGAIAFARSLRKEAEKYQKETEKSNDEVKEEVKKQVREQKAGNIIGLESARLLKAIKDNTTIQTRLMLQQARYERQSRIFAEEETREKLLREKKLLNAIKNLALGGRAAGVGVGAAGGGGILSGIAGLLGNILGGAATVGGAYLGYRGVRALANRIGSTSGTQLPRPATGTGARIGGMAAEVIDSKTGSRVTTIPTRDVTDARIVNRMMPKFMTKAMAVLAGVGTVIAGAKLAPFIATGGAAYTAYSILDFLFGADGILSRKSTNPYGSGSRETLRFGNLPGGVSPYQAINRFRTDRARRNNADWESGAVGRLEAGQAAEESALGASATTRMSTEAQSSRVLSIRNNNPGNLKFANQRGATLGERGFAKFNTPEEGLIALREQIRLDTQVRKLTLSQFIHKYAPQSDRNPTFGYISLISKRTGIKPNELVPDHKIRDVMQAMVLMEGGEDAYFYFFNRSSKPQTTLDKRSDASSFEVSDLSNLTTSNLPQNLSSAAQFAFFNSGTMSDASGERLIPTASVSRGSGTITPQRNVVLTSDKDLTEIAREQNKNLKAIGTSTKSVAGIETQRAREERLSRTRRVETPEQRILRTANEQFLRSFQSLTTSKITSAVERALFPRGYGVTAAETRTDRYRGEIVSRMLGTQQIFNRTFGKEYGPLFNTLSQAYLEVGARNIGQALFSGTEGVNPLELTGQILGNVQRGKKDLALEQLLYGMTGTTSGFETLFAKYGFGTAKEGVQGMSNIFGAGATDIVRQTFPFIGEVPKETFYRDPRTGRDVPMGNIASIPFQGKRADISTIPFQGKSAIPVVNVENKAPGVSATAAAAGAAPSSTRATIYGDPSQIYGYGYGEEIAQATVETKKNLNEYHDDHLWYMKTYHDDTQRWTKNSDKITKEGSDATVGATIAAAQSTGNVFTRGIQWLGNLFTTSAGGGGGGGGTTLGGGGTPTFGNFLLDFGTTLAINKLTSKIRSPYARQIANFALNRVANAGFKTLMSGGDFASFGANLSKTFDFSSIKNIFGFGAGPGLPATVLEGNLLAGSVAESVALGLGGAGVGAGVGAGLPAAALLEGGLSGAAIGAGAGTGAGAAGAGAAGSSISSSLGAIAANPATWIALAAVAVFAWRKSKQKPAIHKIIPVTGNTNINAKFKVFTRQNPKPEYEKLADQFLNVAFNVTKSIEAKTQRQAPFDYIYMRVEVDRVEIDYGQGELKLHLKQDAGPLAGRRWGSPDKTSSAQIAKEIAESVADKFKMAGDADSTSIQKRLDELMTKSYESLAGGIEASVERELSITPSSVEAVEYSKRLQAQVMTQDFKAPEMEYLSGEYGEAGGGAATGERLIYDYRTGKMVRQSETGVGVKKEIQMVTLDEYGPQPQLVNVYDENVIAIDKQGRPVYDIGAPGVDVEDMVKALEQDPSMLAVSSASKSVPEPPPPSPRETVDYSQQFFDRLGNYTTNVVNTNDNSQNITNNFSGIEPRDDSFRPQTGQNPIGAA